MAEEKKEEKKPKTVKVGDVLAREKSAPKSESKSKDSKKKKARMKHTHIEHHADGSHTIRHTPMEGGEEVSYSKPDLDGVHDGLEEHVGEPNEGEEQAGMAEEPPAASASAAPPQPGM